jgi:hypothetical protein
MYAMTAPFLLGSEDPSTMSGRGKGLSSSPTAIDPSSVALDLPWSPRAEGRKSGSYSETHLTVRFRDGVGV